MRNNSMDALIGLGILNDFLKGSDIQDLEKRCEELEAKKRQEKPKVSQKDAAHVAKAIFDSYVEVGFNEIQAFELLKLVLTAKR